MLLPAVGESSPFVPCQVCLCSSLSLFELCLDFTFINKLHLGSSLHSPSVSEFSEISEGSQSSEIQILHGNY